MKEQDNFILDIKRLGINGEGIGFYNKCAVFVDGAIPGEGHNVEVVSCQEKMAFAKSLEIKTSSPDRVNPTCPYYLECGGCNTSHIKYEKMLEFKREILVESLRRYTTLNPRSFEIKPTVASDNIFGYRNRSQLFVKKYEDKLSVCMLKAKSNQSVVIDDCLVQKPIINELNSQILSIAQELGISTYIPRYNRGVLRYLVVRANEENEALVCLVCAEKNSKIKELAKRVIALNNVVGVYENFNDSIKEGTFFGPETNLLEGKPYIIEKIGNIKYRIYPNTFFQLNTKQAEKMFEIIKKACKLSRKEKVLDAYCGVGSIGLYLANMALEVTGIEYSKESVEAATENAELNKIKNARFLQGDAGMLIPKLLEEGSQFDIIVVDPPRTGLDESLISAILNAKVKRVIYASCNPSSLAKDIEKLSSAYNVNSIVPIDMFPQTALVESVVQMTHIESAPVKNK